MVEPRISATLDYAKSVCKIKTKVVHWEKIGERVNDAEMNEIEFNNRNKREQMSGISFSRKCSINFKCNVVFNKKNVEKLFSRCGNVFEFMYTCRYMH